MKRTAVYSIAAFVALPLWGASVDIRPGLPEGKPEATIDLGTSEGARLINGTWRYSDTRIVEVDFRGPGPDAQPTGAPIKPAAPRSGQPRVHAANRRAHQDV